jgi:hypothetical protein
MPKMGMCGASLRPKEEYKKDQEKTHRTRGARQPGARMVKIALQQRHPPFRAYFYKQLKKRHLDSKTESRIGSDEDFFHACTAVVANIARK